MGYRTLDVLPDLFFSSPCVPQQKRKRRGPATPQTGTAKRLQRMQQAAPDLGAKSVAALAQNSRFCLAELLR